MIVNLDSENNNNERRDKTEQWERGWLKEFARPQRLPLLSVFLDSSDHPLLRK